MVAGGCVDVDLPAGGRLSPGEKWMFCKSAILLGEVKGVEIVIGSYLGGPYVWDEAGGSGGGDTGGGRCVRPCPRPLPLLLLRCVCVSPACNAEVMPTIYCGISGGWVKWGLSPQAIPQAFSFYVMPTSAWPLLPSPMRCPFLYCLDEERKTPPR